MIPTRRFWWLVLLGVPIAALGAQAGSAWLGVVYDLLIIVMLLVTWRIAPSGKGLRFVRRFDSVLSVRVANRIELRLENEGNGVLSGRFRDEPPGDFQSSGNEFPLHLGPSRQLSLVYTVTPPDRGDRFFRGTYLRLDCPLGLVEREVVLDTKEAVRVYPNVLALREFDLLRQMGRLRELGIRKSRTRGLGMEFESLREYAQGDDYRKIDWKASARRSGGKLMVRQFEQERNQCLLLCIDIGRHMMAEVDGVRKLDLVLDALLLMTHAVAKAGDSVGLLVYSDRVKRYLAPRRGKAQVSLVIEAIHDLHAEPVESDSGAAFAYLASRWSRRSLLVNFTDYEDEDRAKELVVAFAPMARRHLALLVRVLDPKVDELRRAPLSTEQAMYSRAAATLILQDRASAKTIIETAGIQTLDSEPQDLAISLMNYYFMVKERSLL